MVGGVTVDDVVDTEVKGCVMVVVVGVVFIYAGVEVCVLDNVAGSLAVGVKFVEAVDVD